MVLHYLGQQEEARPLLEIGLEAWHEALNQEFTGALFYQGVLCKAHAVLGNIEEARDECQAVLDAIPADLWSERFFSGPIAQGYALAGLEDEALDLIEHLMSLPYRKHPNRIRRDPAFAELRNNPRFEAILQRAESESAP